MHALFREFPYSAMHFLCGPLFNEHLFLDERTPKLYGKALGYFQFSLSHQFFFYFFFVVRIIELKGKCNSQLRANTRKKERKNYTKIHQKYKETENLIIYIMYNIVKMFANFSIKIFANMINVKSAFARSFQHYIESYPMEF